MEAWSPCERRARLEVRAAELGDRSDGLTRYLAARRADLRSFLPVVLGGDEASSYDEVRLSDGMTAQAGWRRWLRSHDPVTQEALRRYCDADSHAMLQFVRVLRARLRDPP